MIYRKPSYSKKYNAVPIVSLTMPSCEFARFVEDSGGLVTEVEPKACVQSN